MTALKIKYLLFALLLHARVSAQPINEGIAKIEFVQATCFSAYYATLMINSNQGILKATYTSSTGNTERLINSKQLDYFYQFVEELKKFKGECRCNITDKYIVYMNGTSIVNTDASCEWSGFQRLYKKLFAP